MKGLFFRVIILLFVVKLNAQIREDVDFKSVSVLTSYNKEVVEYKFKSLEDLILGIDEIIEEYDFKGKEKEKKEGCDITLIIKVELSLGVTSVVLSESITTLCTDENIGIATKKLKRILIAMAIE